MLGDLLRRFGLAEPAERPDPTVPPFQGGMIGFFGYDLAPRIERLPRRVAARLAAARYPAGTLRHGRHRRRAHGHGRALGLGPDRRGTPGRRTALPRLAQGPRSRSFDRRQPSPPARRWDPRPAQFDRETYLATVRPVLEYIAAGDVFQVNLSQRFTARGRPEPLDLYLRLKAESPAPFAAFLHWDDLAVVSASPEWFYQTRGDMLVTRPIKGTRPRGRRPRRRRAARRRAARLAQGPRRADHDRRPRAQRPGPGLPSTARSWSATRSRSNRSPRCTTWSRRSKGGCGRTSGPIDVIRAVFPGGSITGAPKIRAMEIIDELEPNRRSLYTGAIGYLSRGGSSAFNIAIRTILVEGDRASFQVGGGIVADSDPEAEYEETLAKGRGLLAVLDPGKGGSSPLIWVRGEIVPDDALRISVLDRTFEHGLGLFETFRTWNGHPTLLASPSRAADRTRPASWVCRWNPANCPMPRPFFD